MLGKDSEQALLVGVGGLYHGSDGLQVICLFSRIYIELTVKETFF